MRKVTIKNWRCCCSLFIAGILCYTQILWADDLSSNAVTDAWIPWGDSACVSNEDILFSPWPDWMVSAFKIGGAWDTNIPAWVVEAGDTNEAALNIDVDRIRLTNNVLMRLDYVDHSNATMLLDLYGFVGTNDSDEPVFTSNLFNNLLSGGGGVTSRTFIIPLGLYSNAVGIRLRRDVGAMTVFDALLSSDRDGDGYADSEELAWGSDPDSALSVPCAAITGQVFYAGVQTGVIHVLATTNSSAWASAHYLTMGIPGVYTLAGLPLRQTWYPRAYRDVNGNGIPDDWEPRGGFMDPNGANSLVLTGNTSGVNITLTDPDSDGDGMSDVSERALGLDPYTSNAFARLPFLERFETNTVHLGDVNGQNGWTASPSNTVLVQTSVVWEGSQALALKSVDTPADVRQLFSVSNAPVVWIDVHVQARESVIPTNAASGSALMFFDDNGYLKVYNGLSASSNKWVSLTNVPSSGTTGAWVRLTTKLDYSTQSWLVCVDGILAADGLGFATPVSQFTAISLKGAQGGMDALAVTTNEPSGLSLDGDHLPDDWEMVHFGNLNQTDDGDSDHDGLSNLQEYRIGTNPAQWSTVNDGIPDGWKVAHGLNPLDPSIASQDTDHDGLSNLGEYLAGADPKNASSHCWNISGVVSYAGPQTGLVWVAACTAPTGGAPVAQVSCVTTGAYTLAGLPPNSNYWIRAWVDTDGNGSNDFWEAWGSYSNHSVALFTNLTGINITLSDPDSDGDGMPDWWEIAHGFNPHNPADAVLDADRDGLNNLAEYQHGTDPQMADTDHDGVNDGTEVQYGSDPRVANACSQLPFLERFETNTVHLGDVNGQNGWIASPSNTVLVQTGAVWEGAQALALKSVDTPADVRQLFAVSNAPVVWIDVHVQARESVIPTNAASGSALMFFDANGYLKVYDGLRASSNKWVSLTNVQSSGTTGAWVRLSTRLDYTAQRWLVCVDGVLAADGLGFASPVSQFTAISLKGVQGGMDALAVTTNEPVGINLDGDSLPDDWEMAYFGNLEQTETGDLDHDGLTNLQEFQRGTSPMNPDSDGDGLVDGADGILSTNVFATLYPGRAWVDMNSDGFVDGELTYGTCATNADSDGDGLADNDEIIRYGTDPLDAGSHLSSVSGSISYSGLQTGRIWVVAVDVSNSWATNHVTTITDTGPFAISNLNSRERYWIKAFRDTNGNSSNDFWEAQGWCASNPVAVSSAVTGITVTLQDPDTDGDGVPDWWELRRYGDLTTESGVDSNGDGIPDWWLEMGGLVSFSTNGSNVANDDPDHDGISNIYEYHAGTDPLRRSSQPTPSYFIDAAMTNSGDGRTMQSAFKTIQEGINASTNFEVIQVAPGVYSGPGNINLDYCGKSILLRSEHGQRVTTIDCFGFSDCRGINFRTGESRLAILDGFTIRGGRCADGGGGVLIEGASPTIRDCLITGNKARYGGGLCITGVSVPWVEHCVIEHNEAFDSGGGVWFGQGALPELKKSVCRFNTAGNMGAGIFGGK